MDRGLARSINYPLGDGVGRCLTMLISHLRAGGYLRIDMRPEGCLL